MLLRGRVRRLFPFIAWFPVPRSALRADVMAGIAVALVLVPQSMAYAQLAGMPPQYGLYASLLPVAVGALWGSSRQLATGPVAMVSLLTGTTLAQFAATGSEQFVACAVVLALMVGVLQLALGAVRLGAVVSFLSHPVIVGFTNAAAIIIALSQLNKLLGVPMDRSDHFLVDIVGVLAQLPQAHLPTLAIGTAALALMLACRRYAPKVPGVLIAVALATAISWASGFDRSMVVRVSALADDTMRGMALEAAGTQASIKAWEAQSAMVAGQLAQLKGEGGAVREARLARTLEAETLRARVLEAQQENRARSRALRRLALVQEEAAARFHVEDAVPAGILTRPQRWRVVRVAGDEVHLRGGGEVVGSIPRGFPALRAPAVSWDLLLTLWSTALVITLVGFMEAISIAKSMATRTRQKIDANQELIGQGLANLASSASGAFPVSGSFSRSAVNLGAGAVTGMSSVVTAALVMLTLFFFTPLLYHLPQAVLAAIIVQAVVGLLSLSAMRHAWQAHRHDGIAAGVTFVATLLLAPHLDLGILVGGGLAILLYLYRTMRPRVALLSRHADGTLRDAAAHSLPASDKVVVVRFDGDLYFGNVPYFEDAILEAVASRPQAKRLLIVGDGINEIDASGEEVIRHLVERLREGGLQVAFSGLKRQVLAVMRNTGLDQLIGEANLHRTEDLALQALLAGEDDPALAPARA